MDWFDPFIYTRAPIISIRSGIALARALIDACPPDAPPHVKSACDRLKRTCDAAQSSLAGQQRAAGRDDADNRLLDKVTDRSWSALRMRVEAWLLLAAEDSEAAIRARKLLTTLFGGDGLTFLREAYPVQYTTADTILARIDEDNLQPEIDRLAGPAFLENVRALHSQYEEMVKSTLQGVDVIDMREQIRLLQRAIVHYTTAVCSTANDEVPETVEIARKALRPMDTFRAQAARRASSAAGESEPTDPTDPADSTDPEDPPGP